MSSVGAILHPVGMGWAPGKLDKRVVAALLVTALVVTSVAAGLWSGADRASVADARTVRYVYDDVGRLLAMSDPSTDTAVYRYDPGGNMVAIERRPSAELSVIGISPGEAAPGEESPSTPRASTLTRAETSCDSAMLGPRWWGTATDRCSSRCRPTPRAVP